MNDRQLYPPGAVTSNLLELSVKQIARSGTRTAGPPLTQMLVLLSGRRALSGRFSAAAPGPFQTQESHWHLLLLLPLVSCFSKGLQRKLWM